ncbi:MAG: AzlD domain-containing protein [Deltaproteobacteria bacterium]|nr:AzlD domain-containing protein [Deltaproteobacteria bacterium]MBW2018367.1 AzlD domain-containing protein [Deltaproteobacteria bacterium]MBW2130506.1 AzlD domain-containing protein [Deltaproteobacteria bacterium]MBW2303688.1 AzlD domain-containing protein [Deltaproteobacteria bacterium]
MRSEYILLFAAMGLVTYLPRWLPLHYLSRKGLPPWFVDWLELIPVAILSALLFPDLLSAGEPRQWTPLTPGLIVAVPTFIFALKTRSLAGTVVLGMALFWAAEKIL